MYDFNIENVVSDRDDLFSDEVDYEPENRLQDLDSDWVHLESRESGSADGVNSNLDWRFSLTRIENDW